MTKLPTNITTTALGGMRVQIDWGASPTPNANYKLEHSFLGDFTDTEIIYTGSNLTYIDQSATMDGKCYYRISAYVGNIYSGYRYKEVDTSINDGQTGTTIDFFGDSVTAGVGATGQFGYSQRIVTEIGGTIIGLGGFTITPNPVYNTWNPATGNGQAGWIMPVKTIQRFCVMAYGLNDTNSAASVSASDYQAAVEGFIDFAVTGKSWTAERVIILGPFLGTGTGFASGGGVNTPERKLAFVDGARQAALNKGAAFLSTYDFQSSHSLFPPDGLHPDDAQHEMIKDYLMQHFTSVNYILPPDDTDPTSFSSYGQVQLRNIIQMM